MLYLIKNKSLIFFARRVLSSSHPTFQIDYDSINLPPLYSPISSQVNLRSDLESLEGFPTASGSLLCRQSQSFFSRWFRPTTLHLFEAPLPSSSSSSAAEPLLAITAGPHAAEPSPQKSAFFPLRRVTALRRGAPGAAADDGSHACRFGVSFRASDPQQPLPEQVPRKQTWQPNARTRYSLTRLPRITPGPELWFQAASPEEADRWMLRLERAVRLAFLTAPSVVLGDALLFPFLLQPQAAQLSRAAPSPQGRPCHLVLTSGSRCAFTASAAPCALAWRETHVFYLSCTAHLTGTLAPRALVRLPAAEVAHFALSPNRLLDDLAALPPCAQLDLRLPLWRSGSGSADADAAPQGHADVGLSMLHFAPTVRAAEARQQPSALYMAAMGVLAERSAEENARALRAAALHPADHVHRPDAVYQLGLRMQRGAEGVAQDLPGAAALIRQAAGWGVRGAAEAHARTLLLGIGVPRDRVAAAAILQQEARRGSVKALVGLYGIVYSEMERKMNQEADQKCRKDDIIDNINVNDNNHNNNNNNNNEIDDEKELTEMLTKIDLPSMLLERLHNEGLLEAAQILAMEASFPLSADDFARVVEVLERHHRGGVRDASQCLSMLFFEGLRCPVDADRAFGYLQEAAEQHADDEAGVHYLTHALRCGADEARVQQALRLLAAAAERGHLRAAEILADVLLLGIVVVGGARHAVCEPSDAGGALQFAQGLCDERRSARAAVTLGEYYLSQRGEAPPDPSRAVQCLLKAVEYEPQRKLPHYLLGMAHKQKGDLVQAAAHFRNAVALGDDQSLKELEALEQK